MCEKQISRIILLLLLIFATTHSVALEIEHDAVFVRVIDTGAGLATVTLMPGDHYMVYDAGHWNAEDLVMERIREIIPSGATIDLLITSHNDSDHLGAVDEILQEYRVTRVIRTGQVRDTNTYRDADSAITRASTEQGTLDISLDKFDFPDGATYRFGDAYITKVTGFHEAPSTWDLISVAEKNNANSIVIRLFFKGKSILFTGDAVGRHSGQENDVPLATEKFMIENSPVITIDSDVLIAPHHGADNASSSDFIKEVSPTWVIFSAGHDFGHPRKSTAERFLNQGVVIHRIFRTDLGDDETGSEGQKEWKHNSISGHVDKKGDDDVDILIRPSGEIIVEYRNN